MRARSYLFWAVFLFCLSPFSSYALAVPAERVVIRVASASDLLSVAKKYGLQPKKTISNGSGSLLVVDAGSVAPLMAQLQADPAVLWLEDETNFQIDDANSSNIQKLEDNGKHIGNPDSVLSSNGKGNGQNDLSSEEVKKIQAYYDWASQLLAPNHKLLVQWSFVKIGLYDADMRSTGRGVIVADLDTGVDTCHPVLAGTFQMSFVDEQTIPEDCPPSNAAKNPVPAFGHGTAVGGIIKMVAPESTLWSLRVFRSNGTGRSADIYEAIIYATDHGAQVINMSFGNPVQSKTIKEAVNYAYEHGVILVAAGGNNGTEGLFYPAKNPQVYGVVAVTTKDVKAFYSNYGAEAFVSAPGDKVFVPYPGRNISTVYGTSYASPMVAGEVALLLSGYGKTHTGAPARIDVNAAVRNGSDNIDGLNDPALAGKLGKGRIDVPVAEDLIGIPR